MKQNHAEKLYSLAEACELLSISTATGRNWVKAGRLAPVDILAKPLLFTETTLQTLQANISSGTLSALNRRRNKTQISGSMSYHSYLSADSPNHAAFRHLMSIITARSISVTETTLLCLLTDCADKLLFQSGATYYDTLLTDIISADELSQFHKTFPEIEELAYTYLPDEDTLGFLYLSLSTLKSRKNSGSYYTPAWLAKRLITEHLPLPDSKKTILDPSCGTGVFLLQLPLQVPLCNLYGNDLNPVCVALSRINLAMKYKISTQQELELLQNNITVSNYLYDSMDACYDIILGNPPWGAVLTNEERNYYKKHFICASAGSVDIYDLFVEESLKHLSTDGILSFVLPESILTVKAHTPVRKLLLEQTAVNSIEYLGEVFEQVHCPSIILTVSQNSGCPFFKQVKVYHKRDVFTTHVERSVSEDSFHFNQTDEEYLLLEKLLHTPNCTTLADKSIFALGIVTGDNAHAIHTLPAPGLEPIIRGSDISKYHINSNSGYIAFLPDQFQQTAPENYYRAPEKLFYRFINKQLIFAYDNTGLLSLNSCNIVIPKIPEVSVKYVLAILNSSVAQFIFEKKFHSVKVLRSHLEQIPIPLPKKEIQTEITNLVDKLIDPDTNALEYTTAYSLLDKKIASLYALDTTEFDLILHRNN